MSGARLMRFLPRLLNIVVLVISGAYLLVYLYRWEWNRAIISGVFFISAEIALAASLVLAELRRRPIAGDPTTARAITEANARRTSRRFDWLTRNERLGVFIPVLLGAGVLLSALAYVVERIAGASVGPAADRHTARLIELDLPLATRGTAPPAATRVARAVTWLAAITVTALLVGAGIDVLADATQSRIEEQEATTGTTRVTLEIEQKNLGLANADLAEALWIVCRSVAPPGAELERARSLDDGRVELVLHPTMGELRRRRVFGCLQDAVIDRVRVDVVDGTVG